jgi:enediyne biosynthesis protein E4
MMPESARFPFYITQQLRFVLLLFFTFLFCTCQQEKTDLLFTEVPSRKTGIDFRNMIKEDENFNIFQYQYFYNGGGVAVGDFNNDGLPDLVFTGNMVKNRLYINKGDFQFEDLTKKSGIADAEGWCTGVVPVDINEDGWLDLYICRAGYPFEKLRRNLLYINNGDLTFTEKAAAYGLDDPAHTTQASFFDYDKDGDLDLFLLNHSTLEYSRGGLEVVQIRKKQEPENTNKLFRNDKGRFVNVTEEAGITSNVLTFSLGISIADINGDGWPDIYIANDFHEPDYLFINNKNNTFTDRMPEYFDHLSLFSMGVDAADINHDGHLDIVSLDMLPESNYLQKMHAGADNYNKVERLWKNGFLKQYSRNMLQLNNGDGTFSEIGQLAGVSNTDWSWSALFFDCENDGHTDLFISNGYLRDHTDMDFLQFTADEVVKINKGKGHVDFKGYLEAMPPILQPNYFYQNNGHLQFTNQSSHWASGKASVTQGAAYVDLDNDGDLDMVWNNSGEEATILKNNAETLFRNNYLRVQLQGHPSNPQGIGSKVKVYAGGALFFQEQNPVRGFQTAVDPILSFGLGSHSIIDSVVVIWSGGEKQVLKKVNVNQLLQVSIKNAVAKNPTLVQAAKDTHFKPLPTETLPFTHRENDYTDVKTQFLLPYFYSRQGPAVAVADVNGDELDDVFIGNATGQSPTLFLQKANTTFVEKPNKEFAADLASEDVDATFFDADGDGDMDLYVASGGYELDASDKALQDRLYFNDGQGNFTKMNLSTSQGGNSLPEHIFPSSCVRAADVDQDGDMDLFVGGAVLPGAYPLCAKSQLLLNDGKGKFTPQPLPDIKGIVSDACWIDLNKDKYPELVIAAEWAPVQFFQNQKGKLSPSDQGYGESGLWSSIHAADMDGDGDEDVVIGNLGSNSQLQTKADEPLQLYFGDFDQNNSIDPILCYYVGGKSYPFVSREDLINQLPMVKRKFTHFKDYAEAQIEQVLNPEQLSSAQLYSAETLETVYLENQNGQLIKKPLPIEAMFAPVYAITTMDVNDDGHRDLILAGNNSYARVKLGNLVGNHVTVLLGSGKGDFRPMPATSAGFSLRGDVRSLVQLKSSDKKTYLGFGMNDAPFRLFEHSNAKRLETFGSGF